MFYCYHPLSHRDTRQHDSVVYGHSDHSLRIKPPGELFEKFARLRGPEGYARCIDIITRLFGIDDKTIFISVFKQTIINVINSIKLRLMINRKHPMITIIIQININIAKLIIVIMQLTFPNYLFIVCNVWLFKQQIDENMCHTRVHIQR